MRTKYNITAKYRLYRLLFLLWGAARWR